MSEAVIRSLPPENPQKLVTFNNALSAIKWDSATDVESLTKVFKAVDELADAEVRYYFKRRRSSAAWSIALRFGSLIFGALGVMLPLVAAADPSRTSGLGQWGYVCLAAAGAFVGANALFGATTGHVRFASTQLLLEKIITRSRLAWSQFQSSALEGSIIEPKEVGFKLINAYAEALYSSTLAETGNWSETVISQLNKHANEILGPDKKPPNGGADKAKNISKRSSAR